MKPNPWFIAGSAVAGCAVAAVCYLMQGAKPGPGTDRNATLTPRSGAATPTRTLAQEDAGTPGETPVRLRSQTPVVVSGKPAHTPPPMRISGIPPRGADAVVSEREWFARADKIEREARDEVHRLAEALDLTPSRQAVVFGLLARKSDAWLPGMKVSGTTPADPASSTTPAPSATPATSSPSAAPAVPSVPTEADEVMAYLGPIGDSSAVSDDEESRKWWEEVLPQLLPPEVTKTYEGPDTISE